MNIRYSKFINVFDDSLDLPKIREFYEKATRRVNFTFSDGRHEYTEHIINVTFKYSVKKYNNIFHNCYIKMGYKYDKDKFNDCVWVENGELIGIIINKEYKTPLNKEILGGSFETFDNTYQCTGINETLASTAELREYLYENGFWCDGIKFVRLKRSSGSARVGKCLFINEKIYSRMHRWDNCGLTIRKGMEIDLAAFESYISLTLSSIIGTVDIQPENILLIDDYIDSFNEDVIATRIVDNKLLTKEENVEIKNSIWDGQSLLDSSIFQQNGYGDKGMILLRNRFFKSCCFNTNISEFFRDNGIKKISQLNGYTTATSLSDIKIITTPSSIKYLKFGSFDKWLQTLDTSFGVVKYEKPTPYFDGELVRTHYQLLNTLQMTKDEVYELIKPSIDYIQNIKEDPAYLKLHIKYTPSEIYPKPYQSTSDISYAIMGINDEFCKTRWYSDFRKNIVRKLIKDIKCGKVFVKGNYSTLLGNPVEMLMESIGLFNGESRLGAGKVHNIRFPHGQKLLGSRSPHVTIGNIWLAENTHNAEICRYLNLTEEIICVNSIGEPLLDRLSGCDFDSDGALITDNPILIKAAEKNYNNFKVPANLVESKKTKRYYTPREQCDLDVKTSINKIGEIINLSQELNSILWDQLNNGKKLKDVQQLYYDICQLDIMSNLEIDKAKKEFVIDNVKELKAIREKYIRTTKDGKIIKPYFFAHISREKGYYDKERKCYKKHNTTMDYIQGFMNKVHIKRSGKTEYVDLSQCLYLDNFQINRVKYDQLYRIINRVYKLSDNIKKIWSYEGYENYQKAMLSQEAKVQCYDYINKIKLNQHTMYWLISSIEKPEYSQIRDALLNSLFAYGNSGFLSLIKGSKKPVDLLVKTADGEIDIFGISYTKIAS